MKDAVRLMEHGFGDFAARVHLKARAEAREALHVERQLLSGNQLVDGIFVIDPPSEAK